MKINPEQIAKTIHRFVAAWIILSGLTAPLWSQIGLAVQNESGYTSNAFANYHASPDYFSSTQATINHDWLKASSGIRIFYHGELILFNQYHDRNSHHHEIGYSSYQVWGESENRMDWGIHFNRSFYGETYKWYEREQITGYAQVKLIAKPFWFFYTGVNLSYHNYPLLTPFAHAQADWFTRSSWFFDSGTTFIIDAKMQQKMYAHSDEAQSYADFPEIVYDDEGSSVQGVLSLRAAQSLSEHAGISIEYRVRHNWKSASRYLASSEGGYFSDEDIFEDIFAHHGQAVTTSYRQRLPRAWQFSVNGRWDEKLYDQRLAADLTGVIFVDGRLRSDRRSAAWIEVEKSIKLKTALPPLKLSLTLSWVKNNSNDPFYTYKSAYWGLNILQSL